MSPQTGWNVYIHFMQVFPDADISQYRISDTLHSTLNISHLSHNHSGMYHCNIVDGTNEGTNEGREYKMTLCETFTCVPFITASTTAVIHVLGQYVLTYQNISLVSVCQGKSEREESYLQYFTYLEHLDAKS